MATTITAAAVWSNPLVPEQGDAVSATIFRPIIERLAGRDEYLNNQLAMVTANVASFQTQYATAMATTQAQLTTCSSAKDALNTQLVANSASLATAQSQLATANATLGTAQAQLVTATTAQTNLQSIISSSGTFSFDGTNYVKFPTTTQWDFESNSFTLGCWFNFSDFSSYRTLFASMADFKLGAWVAATRKLGFAVSTTGSTWSPMNADNDVGATLLNTNTWYHVFFVRNGNVFTAYLNGVQEFTKTVSGSVVHRSEPFCLGRWGANCYFAIGRIDKFVALNYAMTQAQITDWYNNSLVTHVA